MEGSREERLTTDIRPTSLEAGTKPPGDLSGVVVKEEIADVKTGVVARLR
jgi:hypothetical protein